jgi:8-oxo-dGTP pyrophosphatase MutT (NUDIX family)
MVSPEPAARPRGTGLSSAPNPLTHPELGRVAQALEARAPAVADAAPEIRRAAVAIILRPTAEDLELLLIQRAEFPGDPWSGQVAFPGGRHDASDPSLVHTAMRETREETGLDLAAGGRLIGVLDELHPRTTALPPIVVRPHVFGFASEPALTLSHEVAAAFWVPLRVLRDPATTQQSRILVRGNWWKVSSLVVEGRVIWGMTEQMLRQVLAL